MTERVDEKQRDTKTVELHGHGSFVQSSTDQENGQDSPVQLRNTYLASFSALMYLVAFGMAASYSAPATHDMLKPGSRFTHITDTEISWISSLTIPASGVGVVAGGYLSHRFGRRTVLVLTTLPYVVGWLLIAYAETVHAIYAGRLLSGFCFGISCVIIPAYLVEIAPVHIRGTVTSMMHLASTVGIFIMNFLGYFFRWSWLAVFGAGVVLICGFIMFLMPETPEWLVRESRKGEAIRAFRFLYGRKVDPEKQYHLMTFSQTQQPRFSLRQILDPSLYKPLGIGISLAMFQQFAGMNSIIAYTDKIFEEIGSPLDPKSSSVVFATAQIASTLICSFLVERAGRRCLFLSSGVMLVISLFTLGLYNLLEKQGYNMTGLQFIPLAGLITYIIIFCLGYGPIPLVIIAELVPIHSRSTFMTLVIVSSSFFSFIVTLTLPATVASLDYVGLFWIYAAFTFSGTLFGFFFLPETKGRTISDINRSFGTKIQHVATTSVSEKKG